jgi:alkylation response protein AidB-like acyl-CoA dehydrogenase
VKFLLDEDQKSLQEGIGRILGNDRIQPRVRAVLDGKKTWDDETWQELVEFGLPALLVPEENDGMGLSLIELAVCAEELGRSAAAVPFLGPTPTTPGRRRTGRWRPRAGRSPAASATCRTARSPACSSSAWPAAGSAWSRRRRAASAPTPSKSSI